MSTDNMPQEGEPAIDFNYPDTDGNEFSLALTSSGEVVAWGRNVHGEIDVPEISDVVAFLGSDLSRYISGEVIFVTGGY